MRKIFVFSLLAAILLTSCGSQPTASPVQDTATPVPTLQPSPTMPAALAVLVLPTDMPQKDQDTYQTLVYNLTQADGMRFQVLNSLSPQDLDVEGPSLKVVIAIQTDPGLEELTAAAPGVQFLAVNVPGLANAPNLSTIGAGGVPVDQQAFLAGYIAGLVAPEWKVGILSQKDTPGGDAAVTAFSNGFVYYCGSCRNPLFPQPAGIYPVIVRIPTDAQPGDYSGYADLLIRNIVKVAYVYPEVASPDVLNYMAQSGMLLIGQNSPGDSVKDQWIASLQPDIISAIKAIFPDLLAGNGGQIVPTPIFLADVNPALLSPGKQRLAQEVLDSLQNGMIDTGVAPSQ